MNWFHRTVFLGHDLSLFLPDPNWASAVEVTYRLAARVDQGRTGRENRKPKYLQIRHELSAAWVLRKADTAALQSALYGLQLTTMPSKRVYIGIPMFMDQLSPKRWSERVHDAAWVINYDASGYTIYASTDLPVTPAFQWFAPLLVGRLENRPKLKANTDESSSLTLKILERSPWDFRIGPAPEGVTPADWPELLVDWSNRPVDWTEDGLDYDDVGAGRVECLDGQEKVMRRGQELTVRLRSRSEIRSLLNFFLARKGRTQSFFAPWQLRAGADSIENPHAPRSRFNEDFLTLRWKTDAVAETRVKMLQVPWEDSPVTGETPEQVPDAYFYRFWIDVPNGPVQWLYTDWEHDLTRIEGVYLGDEEALFQHDKISHAIDLSDAAVTLESHIFTGNPLLLVVQRQLDVPMKIEIRKGTPEAPAEAELVYSGEVGAVTCEGRKLSASTQVLGGILDVKVPNFYYTPNCNYTLCGAGCNCGGAMPPEDWMFTGSIEAINGTVVDVTVTGNPQGAVLGNDYFAQAWIKTGTGSTFELRHIVRSLLLGGNRQRFVLKRVLRAASVGVFVSFFPYCGGTRSECKNKFGNYINFGGHPHIGSQNLSLPSQKINTGAGGKK